MLSNVATTENAAIMKRERTFLIFMARISFLFLSFGRRPCSDRHPGSGQEIRAPDLTL
jgi:hypothetical protein